MKCLIDNSEHESVDDLNKYLRKLKVKQEDYYVKYYHRKDLFSGEPIPFKSAEQYMTTEFVSKENLRQWIKQNPDEGEIWALEWLMKRKFNKELVYPPTQVELRSLLCPSIHYYNTIGGYTQICKEFGFKIRFSKETIDSKSAQISDIIVDTREQLPLFNKSDIKTCNQKLNVGDYGLIPSIDKGIYIERKSLNDFVGTLSGGYERFLKEIERAKEVGAYLVILIESSIDTALDFVNKGGMKFSKVNPAHVFKNLRIILSQFDNVQALFVKDRQEAERVVLRILGAGEAAKEIDLQYAYETGNLN